MPPEGEGSVSGWLGPLQSGDPAAVQPLWERYFDRLVTLARHKLRAAPRLLGDDEDVALSAFDSFCRGACQGRFPQLLDRDDLWRILLAITTRKAARLLRDETRAKRGGPAGLQTGAAGGPGQAEMLEKVLSQDPTPEMAAQLAEDYQLLLQRLADRQLEAVAVARMEGYSVEEIARQLDCAPRTVKRKLQRIRTLWQEHASQLLEPAEQQPERSADGLESWLTEAGLFPNLQECREDRLLRLSAAMSALPAAQRNAIELRHLHGWTLSAIASQLGRTPAATAGLLHRGLKELRTLLHERE